MKQAIVLFVLLGLGLSACGRLENHRVMTGAAGAAHHGEVRIVMENAPVPEGFREIGIVQSVGSGTKAKLEHVVKGLQDEARLIGANVVVRVRVDQGSGHATAVGVAGVL